MGLVLHWLPLVPLDPWDLRVQEVPLDPGGLVDLVQLKRVRARLVLPVDPVDQQMVLLVRLLRGHPQYLVVRWHLVVLVVQLGRYHQ